MPTMANITVKKLDGTTDILWTAIQPAGGDSSPAMWRSESVGSIAGNRPTFQIQAKSTADRKARILEWSMAYPETYTDSTTGIVAVRVRDVARGTVIISLNASDLTHGELAAQVANLLKSALIQSCFVGGFAPN